MSSSPLRRAAVIAAAAIGAVAAVPAAHADAPPANPQLVEQDTWSGAQPLVGSDIFAKPVVEGGWSAFAPIDDNHYWTISDRGPNGQPSVTANGSTRSVRTFLTPAFAPTIYKVAIDPYGQLAVQPRIPLHLRAGAVDPARAYMAAHEDDSKAIMSGPENQITGLPQVVTSAQGTGTGLPDSSGSFKQSSARDEVPYAADGVTTLPGDPYGLDTEAIAVDPRDGSFWLGDEYRPSLVHVAPDGTLLNRIVPKGSGTIAADTTDPAKFAGSDPSVLPTADLLPRVFVFRKQNRGMEGASLTRDGRTLFGMLQSSIEPPAGKGDARTLRIVRFDVSDPAHPQLTGEFVYRLDTPSATSGLKQTDLSISDIFPLDADHLLVDEHDNVTDVAGAGQKRIYEADLTNATNIVGDASANGENPQLEAQNAAGLTPAAKTQVLDLGQFGYTHDKPEGIGLLPNGNLAVQNDNDFGFDQGDDPENAGPNDPPFRVTSNDHTTQLWQFSGLGLTAAGGSGSGSGATGGTSGSNGGGTTSGGATPGGSATTSGGATAGGSTRSAGGGAVGGQGGASRSRTRLRISFLTKTLSKSSILRIKTIKLTIRTSGSGTATSILSLGTGRRAISLGSVRQRLKAGKTTISLPLSKQGAAHLARLHGSKTATLTVKATNADTSTTTRIHIRIKG